MFFPGASITLKTVPGIETSRLHNNKVTAWRKNLAGEAKLPRQNVSIFIQRQTPLAAGGSKELSHYSNGRELDSVKLMRVNDLDKHWNSDGSHPQGSMNEKQVWGWAFRMPRERHMIRNKSSNKKHTVRTYPGGPLAKTELPVQGAQVQSPVRKLDPTCRHQEFHAAM